MNGLSGIVEIYVEIDVGQGPTHHMKLAETPPTPTPTSPPAEDWELEILSDQLGATSGNPIKAGEICSVIWNVEGGETWSRNVTHLQMGGWLKIWNGSEESVEICQKFGTEIITCYTSLAGTAYSLHAGEIIPWMNGLSGIVEIYVEIDGGQGPTHHMKLAETPPTPTPTSPPAEDWELEILSDQLGATSGNPIKAGEIGSVIWNVEGGETWSRNVTHLQMGGWLKNLERV